MKVSNLTEGLGFAEAGIEVLRTSIRTRGEQQQVYKEF
jgi:hypothetical protein